MLKRSRVIIVFAVMCLLFNTGLSDFSVGFSDNNIGIRSNLSPSSFLDDLVGIEHKDMGRIKLAVKANVLLLKEKGLIEGGNIKVKEDTIYDPADMQFFFKEVKFLDNGYISVMSRIWDQFTTDPRTYYAVFSIDDLSGKTSGVHVFTKKEYLRFQRGLEARQLSPEGIPQRSSEKEDDAKAIDRYVEHEEYDKIISWVHQTDQAIPAEDIGLDYSAIIKEIFDESKIEVSTPEWLTPVENRKCYIIPITEEVQRRMMSSKMTVVAQDGSNRELCAFFHSSNNAVHIFLEEEDVADLKENRVFNHLTLGKIKFGLAHEIGIMLGLPVLSFNEFSDNPENEIYQRYIKATRGERGAELLDRVLKELEEEEEEKPLEPKKFAVQDLNTNLKVRDYASGEDRDELFSLARRFRLKREGEGIYFHKAYDEILYGILYRLGVDPASSERDPDEVLIEVFRANGIRNILEVGCGDCAFLASLENVAKEARINLTGIDIEPYSANKKVKKILEDSEINIIKGDVMEMDDQNSYDLIISSGVMSLYGMYPMEKDLTYEAMKDAISESHKMSERAISLLSTHSQAAVLANTFGTILMLDKKHIQEVAEIVLWDGSRKIALNEMLRLIKGHMGEGLWSYLQPQAANFAILAKKKFQEAQKDFLVTNDEVGEMIDIAAQAGLLEIPTRKAKRYTLLMTSEFFANGELKKQKSMYGDRFNLDSISARTDEQFVDKVIAKAKGIEIRTIALVPDSITEEHLARLTDVGIRFIRANAEVLLEARVESEEQRRGFHQNTYAAMLLARKIDENTSKDSSVYRLLEFYLKSLFELSDGVKANDYIKAIVGAKISILLKGILSCRPAEPYRVPEYDKIAATLISA